MKNINADTICTQTVGVDVAADSLQARLGIRSQGEQRHYSGPVNFENDATGRQQLLEWARRQASSESPLWIIMEATGVYYEQLAWQVHQAEDRIRVCVLVPTRVAHYAKSLPVKSKTDAIDARILARYGLERQPRQWQPGPERLRGIKTLLRERQQLHERRTRLTGQRHAARNRYENPASSRRRLNQQLDLIERQLAEVDRELSQLWQTEQSLADPIRRIAQIDGVNTQTVLQVLAETNGFALIDNRRQLASYCGLDVVLDESGNRQGATRISKHGNARIRRALYMPALSAIQHNRALKAFYQRLLDKHPQQKMIAITAVMRKLLLLIYSLWKSGQEYDPEFHYQQITKAA